MEGLSPANPCFYFSEMNRHHYALYIHNCRLVFLLRKDFDQADTFRPAEFHWKLDQVRLSPTPASAHAFAGDGGPVYGGKRFVPMVTAANRHPKMLIIYQFVDQSAHRTRSISKSRWQLYP